MADPSPSPVSIPYRQIRAYQNPTSKTLTLYAAFSNSIAQPALDRQKLDASPNWVASRVTWVKPSWSWMMYRCGYGFKDPRQEKVLALEMKIKDFVTLMEYVVMNASSTTKHGRKIEQEETIEEIRYAGAEMTSENRGTGREMEGYVRVQWDPERSPSLQRLSYRSIQIGIPGAIKKRWVDEWIVSIQDVTERARGLKEALEKEPGLSLERLVEMGLVPMETVIELPEHLRERLRMD